MEEPLIANDAAVFAVLISILAIVFHTSSSSNPYCRRFYKYVPSLLVCYFVPGLLSTLGVISPDHSRIYSFASRYLLPASLVLFTLSMDVPAIIRLGYKSVALFFSGTVSVIVGGPLSILIVSLFAPSLVGGNGANEVWRGMATTAGSWIGGSANQTALKEVFGASGDLFSAWVTVDVLVASVWMAFVLFGASRAKEIDRWNGADTSALEDLQHRTAEYQAKNARIPSTADLMAILGVAFVITGVSHVAGEWIAPWIQESWPQLDRFSLTSSFFWLVIVATTGGIIASFTRLRNLEAAGASRIGSVLLYILVASVGMSMDLFSVLDNPGYFLVGFIWLGFHAATVLIVGRILRVPFFFVAVGSEANIGGAASAPIVAAAFHPALAPVGVLLAVLGYAVGTYGGWLCGILMQLASPN